MLRKIAARSEVSESAAPSVRAWRLPEMWLAGLVSVLLYVFSFPPWDWGFLAWIALAPLIWALPTKSWQKDVILAGFAGFLANLATLYWVFPTCRLGGVGIPTSALALAALAGYMALYWAAFGLLARPLGRAPAPLQPIAVAAAWTALEWIRAQAFTGFPWLLLAYSQWKYPVLISLAELGGAYAVSFWVVLPAAALAQAGRWFRRPDELASPGMIRPPVPRPWAAVAVWAILAGANIVLWQRPLEPAGPALSVAIVQGNIDQYRKWDEAYEEDILRTYSALTRQAAQEPADLIVWPETAVPGWIPNEPRYVQWLQGLARETRTYLLTGAATRQGESDYNAAFLFSSAGAVAGQYRKQHLVPFGEFVPAPRVLSRFIRVLNELGEFKGSEDNTVFRTDKARFSVNICFEDLFPELVARFIRHGAQMSVNLTNDGWYMRTAAPEQHFIPNVFRAVETRAWVIRAANTGVSGFIDPRGRVAARSALLEQGVLRGRPEPMDERTFYVRYGDVFAYACALVVSLSLLVPLWRRRGKSRP